MNETSGMPAMSPSGLPAESWGIGTSDGYIKPMMNEAHARQKRANGDHGALMARYSTGKWWVVEA